ncbi:hypothetical protein BBJ28_00012651 [Nothophytophthora sp. Chile5]|nr:hypothetical protein BBJ28_00012651 [Nothophytophthora sp. Chile5]
MKAGAFVAAAATALAALSAPTQVSAATCDTLTLVVTLLPLLADANTCASDTGYTLYPFTGLPTAAQLALICADSTCTGVLADAVALDLPDCTISYDGVDYNVKDELTLYATACGVARNSAFPRLPTHEKPMKTGALAAVAITAFASLSAPSLVAAAECEGTTLAFALLPLSGKATLCAADAVYTLYPFTGMPSFDELKEMCSSDACTSLLDAAADADLPDCDVTVDGSSYNVKESVSLMQAACKVIGIFSFL